jgi:hypothetical protein
VRTPVRRWTHTRLVALLAGGLLAGSLLGAGAIGAAPAYADGNLSVNVNPGTVNLTVGGAAQTFDVQVKAGGGDVHNVVVAVTLPLSNYGVQSSTPPGGCVTQQANELVCSVGDVGDNQEKDLTFGLAPPGTSSIGSGQSQTGSGQVQAQSQGGGQNASGSYSVTLTGAGPSSVGQVSGTLIDATTGSAVTGAQVTIKDSGGHSYPVSTDNSGNFMFAPSANQPLSPGNLTVTFTATGYTQGSTTAVGQQGQPVAVGTIQLTKAASTASATPSAAPSKTAAGKHSSTAAAPKSDSGLGFVTWLLIILGALLVIGGIIAIVFLLRRKDKGDDDPGEDGPMFGGPNGGGQPGQYGGDPAATTVLNRVPPNGVSPDAPTMVHNGPLVPPDRDEFDDYDNFARSYGTSGFQNPGGATQRYDQPTQSWQPNPNEVTRPVSSPHADNPTQAWRPGQDEPTRGWNPNSQDQPTRAAYQQPAPDRYNEPTNPGNNPNAGPYDQPTSRGRHGAPEQDGAPLWPDRLPNDGYGQPSGPPATPYGQQGGAPAGNYGQPSGPPAGNYGQPSGPPANTYGQQSGNYGQPSAPPAGQYGQPSAPPRNAYGSPTSGSGYGSPGSDGGYGNGGGNDQGYQGGNGGGGYGRAPEPTQQWNQNQGHQPNQGNQGYGQGNGQGYGQPPADQSRHRVDDPTRTWNASNVGRPPSPPPSLDETRLERRDGVDWLDG